MLLTYLYLTIYLLHEAFEPIIKEIYRIRKFGTAQVLKEKKQKSLLRKQLFIAS